MIMIQGPRLVDQRPDLAGRRPIVMSPRRPSALMFSSHEKNGLL